MSKKNKLLVTPAVIRALADDDLANATAALIPEGIEAQESLGQQNLCRNGGLLPRYGTHQDRSVYEAMGIAFGEPMDDLFIRVTLPEGWKIEPTDHSMHSNLVDAQGRKRAHLFYKAAFYDRQARISLVRRFSIQQKYCNDKGESLYCGSPTHSAFIVLDGETEIYSAAIRPSGSFTNWSAEWWDNQRAAEALDRAECEAWLGERYPDWQSYLAYWD